LKVGNKRILSSKKLKGKNLSWTADERRKRKKRGCHPGFTRKKKPQELAKFSKGWCLLGHKKGHAAILTPSLMGKR